MFIPHKQLTLTDIYDDCQEFFENDKPAFLTLLANHINLDKIVPFTFNDHFYASTGRPHKYSLYSILWALIIQRIFSIDTDSLSIISFAESTVVTPDHRLTIPNSYKLLIFSFISIRIRYASFCS